MGYIYKITNNINENIQIGQTNISVEERFKAHCYCSFNHRQTKGKDEYYYPIHQAIRKYGVENFSVEILEECSQELLNQREIYWIKFYDSYHNGYNATLGGDGNSRYDYDEIVNFFLQNNFSILLTCQHFKIYDQVVYSALKSKNIDYKSLTDKKKKNQQTGKKKKIKMVETGQIFNSMSAIDSYFGKKAHPNIRRCLNGITEKAYGYHWEEVEDE